MIWRFISDCSADRDFCSEASVKQEWCDRGNSVEITLYNGEEGTIFSFCPHFCGLCFSKETGKSKFVN